MSLNGSRILVVGASTGIGRATGLVATKQGARVAFAARRQHLLEEAVAEAGAGCVAVPCDVRDPASCEAAVARTVAELGGLDAVVYATGMSPLAKLHEASHDLWRDVFDTNVLGAGRIAAAAFPHLREAGGRLVFLSSNSTERPFPGLGVYAASKAALDAFVQAWRSEVPEVPAVRVVVGPTNSGNFTASWDQELAVEMFGRWQEEGYLEARQGVQQPEDVAHEICNVLVSPTWVTDVRVMPFKPVET